MDTKRFRCECVSVGFGLYAFFSSCSSATHHKKHGFILEQCTLVRLWGSILFLFLFLVVVAALLCFFLVFFCFQPACSAPSYMLLVYLHFFLTSSSLLLTLYNANNNARRTFANVVVFLYTDLLVNGSLVHCHHTWGKWNLVNGDGNDEVVFEVDACIQLFFPFFRTATPGATTLERWSLVIMFVAWLL